MEGVDGKPVLLDLFCGAGGASRGYQLAGFYVIGVDISPQPNHAGDEFVQADATQFPLDGFRYIHASPPCQRFSFATRFNKGKFEDHPDLIDPIRQRLVATNAKTVIENVPGAPVRKDIMLCGEMFGLRVHRHRYFEVAGFEFTNPKHQKHKLKGAAHNCDVREGHARQVAGHYSNHPDACEAMGIDWMNRHELPESIPPAYTEFIGRQMLNG